MIHDSFLEILSHSRIHYKILMKCSESSDYYNPSRAQIMCIHDIKTRWPICPIWEDKDNTRTHFFPSYFYVIIPSSWFQLSCSWGSRYFSVNLRRNRPCRKLSILSAYIKFRKFKYSRNHVSCFRWVLIY